MGNSFPFPIPNPAAVEGRRRVQEANDLVRNRKPGPFGGRDSLFGLADTFVRGAADEVSLGAADEFAASMNSGSFAGHTPDLWGSYEHYLNRERAIDEDDEKNRYAYRKAGQVAGQALKEGLAWSPPGMLMDAAYGFARGEGGFQNRLQNAVREAALGKLWDTGGAWISRQGKAGWKTLEDRFDLDNSFLARKVEDSLPTVGKILSEIGKDKVKEWLDSFDGDKVDEQPASNAGTGQQISNLRQGRVGSGRSGGPGGEVGRLDGNRMAARLVDDRPRTTLPLSESQRRTLIQSAQRRADLPADWRKRILTELLMGSSPSRGPSRQETSSAR